jgi:hypothetical protein
MLNTLDVVQRSGWQVDRVPELLARPPSAQMTQGVLSDLAPFDPSAAAAAAKLHLDSLATGSWTLQVVAPPARPPQQQAAAAAAAPAAHPAVLSVWQRPVAPPAPPAPAAGCRRSSSPC